jgi:hypothetical protein
MSTHEDLTMRHDAKQSSHRSFGIVFAVAFFLIGLIPLLHKRPIRSWALTVGLAFILAAFLWPSVLAPLNRMWTRVGIIMNSVMSPVVMAVLLFGVFTPVAIIMRRFGAASLRLHYEPNRTTYWINRESSTSTASMDRQF